MESQKIIYLLNEFDNENDILSICDEARNSSRYSKSMIAGIEMACLNYFNSWDKYLSSKPQSCVTSMSIPILEESQFNNYAEMVDLWSFENIKIKSGPKLPMWLIHQIAQRGKYQVSIDYNEALPDIETMENHLVQLSHFDNIKFIEQPFKSTNIDLYKKLKKISNYPIIIDETITTEIITQEYREICDGVNFKVMKSGGIIQTLKQIKSARDNNLICMLGCMIESSLSISSYVKISSLVDYKDLDGSLFLKDDPFMKISLDNGIITI